MACLDTTFLVDLFREVRRRVQGGPAWRMFVDLVASEEPLRVTLFTVGEMYAGLQGHSNREKESLDEILSWFEILPFDVHTARVFGTMYALLRSKGSEIGILDTLIASVALVHGETILTRNARHFRPVPGLSVREY